MGALLSLLTKPARTLLRDETDSADVLLIDATIKISPEYEAETTDSPVEGGTDVTDHVILKPVRISVQGEMSETPLTIQSELSGLVTAAGSLIGNKLVGGFGASVGAFVGGQLGAAILSQSSDGDANAAIHARRILEQIITTKQIFTLVDKYKKYPNMVMTSLSFPRDQKTGHKLEFSFTAKQLTIVSSQTTQISKISKKISSTAAKAKSLGEQTAEAVKNPASILSKLTGIGGH